MHPAEPKPSRRRRLLIASVITVAASACVLVGFGVGAYLMLVRNGIVNPAWTEANILRSQERASRIIEALSAYHDRHGVYPETLYALVPESLDALPAPVAGVDEWSYASTEGGTGFVLQFSANRFDTSTAWYESRHARWFMLENGEISAEAPPTP